MKNILLLARRAAGERGGTCLTQEHRPGVFPQFRFRCESGHVWAADAKAVIEGAWCPKCKPLPYARTYSKLLETVAGKRGAILTAFADYRGVNSYSLFRCDEGHEWQVRGATILAGWWCAECGYERRRVSLEEIREITAKHGWTLVSKERGRSSENLRFRCARGHLLVIGKLDRIKKGHCESCRREHASLRLSERVQKIVAEKGGRIISAKGKGRGGKFFLICKSGHQWRSSALNILQGHWCSACYHDRCSLGLEAVRLFAERHGGECLSTSYRGTNVQYHWRCFVGHEFFKGFRAVERGVWCPFCNPGKTKRRSIEQMRALAEARGGRCLSTEYFGSKVKIEWECSRGHQWKAIPNVIQQGSWCPTCARGRPEATRARWPRIELRQLSGATAHD